MHMPEIAWGLVRDYLIGTEDVRYWMGIQSNKGKIHPVITNHNEKYRVYGIRYRYRTSNGTNFFDPVLGTALIEQCFYDRPMNSFKNDLDETRSVLSLAASKSIPIKFGSYVRPVLPEVDYDGY